MHGTDHPKKQHYFISLYDSADVITLAFCIDQENVCSGIMKTRDVFEHGHGRRCEAMDGASEEHASSRDYPGQDDDCGGLTAEKL